MHFSLVIIHKYKEESINNSTVKYLNKKLIKKLIKEENQIIAMKKTKKIINNDKQ